MSTANGTNESLRRMYTKAYELRILLIAEELQNTGSNFSQRVGDLCRFADMVATTALKVRLELSPTAVGFPELEVLFAHWRGLRKKEEARKKLEEARGRWRRKAETAQGLKPSYDESSRVFMRHRTWS